MEFYYFISDLNITSFLLVGYDKYLAKNHQNRISEKTLLIGALIGGTIGSGVSMLFFRHKTAKKSYLLKFLTVFILQILILLYLCNTYLN
jgi:uncharacterized membrane protein YsdA (DUF1294 family)